MVFSRIEEENKNKETLPSRSFELNCSSSDTVRPHRALATVSMLAHDSLTERLPCIVGEEATEGGGEVGFLRGGLL